MPLDRVNTRAIDRTGGTMLHTSRTNPRKMQGRSRCRTTSRRHACDTMTTDGETCDLTPVVLENIERLGLDYLVPIGGDDTLSFSQTLADARRAAHRHPQDHGQRRPGHRVLHRLLDRHHARQGAHQPPADDARLARAHRRVPHLRPGLRLHGAVHRVRDDGPLPHPRVPVRPRPPGRGPRRGPPPEPQPLRRSSSPRKAPCGRAATLEEVGEADAFGHRHKANIAETLAAEIKRTLGHRERVLGADLRPALGRAGRGRHDGRVHVRERGHGPHRRWRERPHDGHP